MKEKNLTQFAIGMAELMPVYQEAKSVMLLAERLEGNSGFPVAAMHEISKAMDQVMVAFDRPEISSKAIAVAKQHLLKSTSNGYAIFLVESLMQIEEALKGFEVETIAQVFPEYFQKIKPRLVELHTEVAALRQQPSFSIIPLYSCAEAPLLTYSELVQEVLEIRRKIYRQVTTLAEFQKKSKKGRHKGNVRMAFLTIGAAVLGAVLTFLLSLG